MTDELQNTFGGDLFSLLLMRDNDDEASEKGEIYWKGVLVLYVMPIITIATIIFIRYKQRHIRREEHSESIEQVEESKMIEEEESKKDK